MNNLATHIKPLMLWSRLPDKTSGEIKIVIFHFSTKTYVVGTQRNHLNEMAVLSTQSICLTNILENYLNFRISKFI